MRFEANNQENCEGIESQNLYGVYCLHPKPCRATHSLSLTTRPNGGTEPSLSSLLICTTGHRIPVSTSTNKGE